MSEIAPDNFELARMIRALEERVAKLEKALVAKPVVVPKPPPKRRT